MCICICICLCGYAYVRVRNMCICMYAHMHVCTRARMHCTCVHVCTRVNLHACHTCLMYSVSGCLFLAPLLCALLVVPRAAAGFSSGAQHCPRRLVWALCPAMELEGYIFRPFEPDGLQLPSDDDDDDLVLPSDADYDAWDDICMPSDEEEASSGPGPSGLQLPDADTGRPGGLVERTAWCMLR